MSTTGQAPINCTQAFDELRPQKVEHDGGFVDRLGVGPLTNSGEDVGRCRHAQVSEDESLLEGIPG
jgi:hypothetical protein